MIFARRFRDPYGIARSISGVWKLPFPAYFLCCPFILITLNCRSPSGDQLIFMSKNGNSSFFTTWTLSYFAGRGDFASVVHIYVVNWNCWFPASLFTVSWNSSNQYFISLHYRFPWTLLGRHLDRYHGRLQGLENPWLSQKGKTQPSWLEKLIHIHQYLTLVLLFFRNGICITLRQRRLGWISLQSGWAPGIYWWFFLLLR